jgi:hypothetical protein
VPAGPGADALRAAYLGLLKLALCDLSGTGTISVWKHTDGSLMSRELTGDDLNIRAGGVDWPLHGVTMVGVERLDDLQIAVEADSFQGFPAPDDEHPDRGDLAPVDYLAVPEADVRANFARLGYEQGVRFLPGFFDETLPGLTGRRWSVIRLDCDSYEATALALDCLYPGLSVGGFVIIDDYGSLEECRQAVDEFRARHGITEPIEDVDWTCARWRRTAEAAVEAPARGPAGHPAAAPRAVERTRDDRIVSMYERALRRDKRHLERELGELRHRLEAAETEVRALHGSPLRGPRVWLRRRLGRD